MIVLTSAKNGVFTIRLNRPDAKNAMDAAMYEHCTAALKDAGAREDVLVVVFTGNGKFFSSGADLAGDPGDAMTATAAVREFMLTLLHFPKPVITAVNGPAVGIGFTMLLHSDVVYCTQQAWFWAPFARIAVVPEFASSVLLAPLVGNSVANEMILMGRRLSADEALRAGVVSHVFTDADAMMKEVEARAEKLVQLPLADRTLPLFKRMMRKHQLPMLERVVVEEMDELNRRVEAGETAEAVMHLLSTARSKL